MKYEAKPISGRLNRESEEFALEVIDEFQEAFNARDMVANSKTLNYPHVRIASGKVEIYNTPEEYSEANKNIFNDKFEAGWGHSIFDTKDVIQSTDDKVHVAVQFSRFDGQGERIAVYHAIYVATLQDDHWGVQARTSFAP